MLKNRLLPIFRYMFDGFLSFNKSSGEIGDAGWHVDFIVHLASVLRPEVYVELGIHECETFNRVSKFSDSSFGVDISSNAAKHIKNKEQFYLGTTDSFAEKFRLENKKINLLFIDADHSEASVMEDFNNFLPFMAENSVILLHDGYPLNSVQSQPGFCGDGYKAIFELSKQRDDFELMTIPFAPGLSLCRVRSKQVPWA